MKLLVLAAAGVALMSVNSWSEQPAGAADALRDIASEHATHTSFTLDRDMIDSATGMFGDGSPVAGLNSITFENYKYHEPAFYVPENVHALAKAYDAAGWMHLVDKNVTPKESASPTKPITDMWMHFHGTNVDGVTVVVRGVKQMSVIEVSGVLKPLDIVHLSGHFGIPKVDPSAVMVPDKSRP